MSPSDSHYACMSNEINPPAKRGCLFYGCLSLAVIALLVVVVGIAGYFVLKNTTERWIRDFTETTPAQIEKVEFTRAQTDAMQARLASFKQALDGGTNLIELILTADDLNALISTQRELKDKLFIRIDGDQVRGDISMPLGDLGPLKLKGRYLNANVTLKVSLANGSLDVRLHDAQVKGKPLPSMILNEFKKNNLAQEYQKDPKTAADIAKFEAVQVTNGTVVLRNKVTER